MVYDLSVYCWIRFAGILLRIFVSCVHQDTQPVIFLFCDIIPGFGIKVMVALESELGSVLSFETFGKSFRRIGISFPLNV